ncbi:MAG: hypothetical protein HQ478_11125 [Chloroflexi bacterium]|nr:hypothetical protein [Chloroflexota bacterium]
MLKQTVTATNDEKAIQHSIGVTVMLTNSIHKHNRIKNLVAGLAIAAAAGAVILSGSGGTVNADVAADETGAISPPVTEKLQVKKKVGATDLAAGLTEISDIYNPAEYYAPETIHVSNAGATDLDGLLGPSVPTARAVNPIDSLLVADSIPCAQTTDECAGLSVQEAEYHGEAPIQPIGANDTDM